MIIIGLLLTIYFGYCLIKLSGLNVSGLMVMALSYLIGIGVQTLLMFYLAVIGVKLNLYNISSVLLVISFLITLWFWYSKKNILIFEFVNLLRNLLYNKPRELLKRTALEILLVLTIAVIFIFVFLNGAYMPITGWDSMALYDFRAKVFFATGAMKDAIDRGYFFGYPLLTSMMNTWVYILGNQYPRFMYSLIYISLSVIFYSLARYSTSKIKALMFTLLLMLSPQVFSHSSFDYSNMPYTAYFFISSAMLYLWIKNKQISFLIISAIMMGLATWIRSTDPFWIVNIVTLLIWCFVNRKLWPLLAYISLFLPIQQSWNVFVSSYAQIVSTQVIASSSLSILSKGLDIGRFLSVIKFVIENIGLKLSLYAILAVIATFIGIKKAKTYIYLSLILIGNIGLLVVGSYVFSFIWPGWGLIGESLQRMSFVFVPLLLYYSLVAFSIHNENK